MRKATARIRKHVFVSLLFAASNSSSSTGLRCRSTSRLAVVGRTPPRPYRRLSVLWVNVEVFALRRSSWKRRGRAA